MANAEKQIRRTICEHNLIERGDHIVLGLSGGPDSVCLFHVLRGMAEDRARLLARLSQGSVGRALEMDASEGWWQLRDRVLASLAALRDRQDVAVAALPLAEKREQANDILDILELCARDLMVIQDAGGGVVQTDVEDRLAQLGFSGSRALMGVMEARKMLSSNVAWQSALEMLFFKMAGG